MHYGAIKYCDIANGAGVRTSLFVSGCRIHCFNCFNQESQSFDFGEVFTREVEDQIIESLRPAYVRGLTVLGGDPMEPENQRCLLPFLQRVVLEVPEKSIWCYTGYLYDKDLQPGGKKYVDGVTSELLECIDVLVDGPFVQEKYDITLRFRGSSNQRLINLEKTREEGEVSLWQDDPLYTTHKM